MKALMFLLACLCCSCVNPQLKAHKDKLAESPRVVNRDGLYALFPPVVAPEIFPAFGSSSGLRGNESYPIDEEFRVTYQVWYKDSPGYQEMISSAMRPSAEFKPWKIEANPEDSISNVSVHRIR